MFCFNCGKEIAGQMKFCPSCGTALDNVNQIIEIDNSVAETQKENELIADYIEKLPNFISFVSQIEQLNKDTEWNNKMLRMNKPSTKKDNRIICLVAFILTILIGGANNFSCF